MTALVTGAAGFIGYHLSKRLLEAGHQVIGIDNINDYYSPDLKFARLSELGIARVDAELEEISCLSEVYPNFIFYRVDVSNAKDLGGVFKKHPIDKVCHLAAQAGVRYSIENPSVYIQSNLVGFGNILEEVRHAGIDHLIYASSSSVYGESKEVPFSTDQQVDHPISLYAATKKANELMAHTYSHLYNINTTGLRFFTVYGPYGRPDMAYYLFTKAILKNQPIKVFNNGEMRRDFTYIDDIVEGLIRIIENPAKDNYKIYNIGNHRSEQLGDFIAILEKHLGKTAKKELLPMQPGDVSQTYAEVSDLIEDYGYAPNTSIDEGLKRFVQWYLKSEVAKKR
jgi:UDP-glucuronate 4-epimerase